MTQQITQAIAQMGSQIQEGKSHSPHREGKRPYGETLFSRTRPHNRPYDYREEPEAPLDEPFNGLFPDSGGEGRGEYRGFQEYHDGRRGPRGGYKGSTPNQ